MNTRPLFLATLIAFIGLLGCGTSTMLQRNSYSGGKIPRPAHILVQDFSANPKGMPGESASSDSAATTLTPEQQEYGRRLGGQVASRLAEHIRAMGLPAERTTGVSSAKEGDLVIKGYFVSMDSGDAAKRVMVGFGQGAAELRTYVEGYLMTPRGLRRVGSGELEGSGDAKPGMLAGVVGLAATGNPIGLIVGGASKLSGESKGSQTLEGIADQTARDIAKALQEKFKSQGWI